MPDIITMHGRQVAVELFHVTVLIDGTHIRAGMASETGGQVTSSRWPMISVNGGAWQMTTARSQAHLYVTITTAKTWADLQDLSEES